jgi:cob(I)alamin adenosyltransferase
MRKAVKNATPAVTPNVNMSVYTRFGDKGKTSLYAGKTVSKASIRVEAYGSIDELNSFLGIVLFKTKDKTNKKELVKIQNDLFEIGSALANPAKNKDKFLSEYLVKRVQSFEKQIDAITQKLPELENFILPGGGSLGSSLHFARTIARRAERKIVELSQKEDVNGEILVYTNRLSDLLFTLARDINVREKQKEIIWKKE